MRDAVDAPWEAIAGQGDGLDGAGLEGRHSGSGEAQPVFDAGTDFLAVEGAEVEADHDALREGLMGGHGKPAAQLCQADQQQAKPLLGIHLTNW